MNQLLLGLDIGGTKCAALVGTSQGEVLDRRAWPSEAQQGPEMMLQTIVEHARDLLFEHPKVVGVGVAIGGPLDCAKGVIHSPPNLPGWDGIELKALLANALGLPVRVEHDAAACALAETRWGLGRELGDSPTLIYLTCGTGFGAGLILHDKVWHGRNGQTPEIGHIRLSEDGPVAFGKKGSAEAFCAGASLPRIAAWRYPERWKDHPPQGPQLNDLWKAGDAEATAVVELHAAMTGRVCAILADLLIPDAIVLGSLAMHLGFDWLTLVRQTFIDEALPANAAACRLEPSQLGQRLQDLSSLAVALTP